MGVRRQVSLLLDHGHPHAWNYPIGMVRSESLLVEERLNNSYATTAILLQMAVSAVLSEEAGKEFQKTIEGLTKG